MYTPQNQIRFRGVYLLIFRNGGGFGANRAAGIPADQLAVKQMDAQRHTVELAGQGIKGTFAQQPGQMQGNGQGTIST